MSKVTKSVEIDEPKFRLPRWAKNLGLFVWLILTFAMPYQLSQNYQTASTAHYVSLFMLFVFFAAMYREFKSPRMELRFYGLTITMRIVTVIMMIWAVVMALFAAFPVMRFDTSHNGEMEKNVIYVTYADNCSYCEAAKTSTDKAVAAYNATHLNRIEFVNIDKDSKLSNDIRQHLTYKGEVIKKDKNGTIYHGVYTMKDSKGPIDPGPAHIYDQIVKTQKGREK